MPAVALSRAGARVVESGPAGTGLAADTWARLEALPDPRSPQGRVYPLACLVAVALCALTAAGHDRLSAVGQWVKRASQADLARLRAPWDPIAGRYRAPDEKTVRVVLDRLDPQALSRALLGPRPARTPAAGEGGGGLPATTVRVWRSRRAKAAAMVAARSRLPGVALDGKTSRGARRPDGTRVHLLGVTEHAGRFLDQVEVDVKHNETSHLRDLLAPLDLTATVVTFDALHTVRSNLDWLVDTKKAHYIAVIKANQPKLHPKLHARVKALPWAAVPTAATTREAGHGRLETRTIKTAHVADLDLPHAHQAIKITRRRQDTRTGKTTRETIYAATSLSATGATGADLARHQRHPRRRLPPHPRRPTRPHHPHRSPPPPPPHHMTKPTTTEHAGALVILLAAATLLSIAL